MFDTIKHVACIVYQVYFCPSRVERNAFENDQKKMFLILRLPFLYFKHVTSFCLNCMCNGGIVHFDRINCFSEKKNILQIKEKREKTIEVQLESSYNPSEFYRSPNDYTKVSLVIIW